MGTAEWMLCKINKRVSFLQYLILTVASLIAFTAPSWGETDYPSKKIIWLIPYKPAGGIDIFARSISPYVEKYLKRMSPKASGGAIIIKNEPAAAGEKSISLLFNAAPDGYTMGSFTGGFLAEQFLTKKDYDITKLTYLIRLDDMTRLLVTRKAGPRNWSDLVAASKLSPIKWGVGAYGREIHIASIVANEALGLPSKFIAYGGTSESLNALIRGDVQIVTVSEDSAKALIDSGELRVLLSFDKKSAYPEATSVQDLGHPELINLTKGNRFLAGPPALPKKVEKSITEAFQRACKDEGFVALSKKTGFEPNAIYNKDLENLLKELMNYYREKAPLIKKRLD
jgi:tripartite-type tricarboxylate transporter receptor subunit TctC